MSEIWYLYPNEGRVSSAAVSISETDLAAKSGANRLFMNRLLIIDRPVPEELLIEMRAVAAS
jgi:hypothetical protein